MLHIFFLTQAHTPIRLSAQKHHTRAVKLLTQSAFLLLAIYGQEPRKRHPLPDHAWFRPGHGHRSGSLPAAEEGPEQTDDWRVLGEQQAAIQQGCPRVSPLSL